MPKTRILVVEDVRFVARDIQDFLEDLGYSVPGLSATGEEAIRAAEQLSPDLILMDIGLKGDMDGIQAAKFIRQRLDVPLIYLTGQGDEATVERAKLTAPYAYLRKPLNEKDLPVAIEIALAKHDLEQKLRKSNADLEQFGYVVSHDLQSPLGNIEEFTNRLIAQFGDGLDPKAGDYMTRILNNVTRMKRLIKDLLEYSRVDSSEVVSSTVDTAVAIQAACANLQSALEQCGGEVLGLEISARVVGDESQLVQLFQNLLGNAIKFRQPDVPLRIRLLTQRREGFWEFSVSDNGIGIEPQYLKKIFLLHERLHSVSKGHGIGLATCEKIVKRHGGTIWAESTGLNQGNTMRFTLQAAAERDDAELRAENPGHPGCARSGNHRPTTASS
jgi:two-component system, sensor histidine kinase and response regulator